MDRTCKAHKEKPLLKIVVIGNNFCLPNYSVKVSKIARDNFTVEDDVNRNIMTFMIEDRNQFHHVCRVLCDAQGNHIVTLQKKIVSAHDRWEALPEGSTESKDLLFSAKRSWRNRTNLDVSLASNGNKCIFKVTGTLLEKTFQIKDVGQDIIIARMENDKLIVHQNVDYAFVVALIVIQDGQA